MISDMGATRWASYATTSVYQNHCMVMKMLGLSWDLVFCRLKMKLIKPACSLV